MLTGVGTPASDSRLRHALKFSLPLVLVAALFIPALRVGAPLLGTQQWSVAALGVNAIRPASRNSSDQQPGLGDLLRRAKQLEREFTPGRAKDGRLDLAFGLAALIPIAALLAGICAVACLGIELAPGKRQSQWFRLPAFFGLISSTYAGGASFWLTHVAQSQAQSAVSKAAAQFGNLLGHLDVNAVRSNLIEPLGVWPQAGLYVLALGFAAILLWPAAERAEL